MRLRLDKLVLSAGLALAMVATTIPAIAGTTTSSSFDEGLTKISTDSVVTISDTDFRTAVFAKTAQEASKTISPTVTRTTLVASSGLAIDKSTDANPSQKTTNYAKSQNVDLVGTKSINISEGIITVTETFALSEYIYTSAAISQESTSGTTINSQDAANSYVNSVIVKKVIDQVLADNSITIDAKANPAVTLVSASNTAAIVDSDKTESKIVYTEAGIDTAAKVTVAANTQFRVSGNIVVESKYTVDTLPSDYAFDVAFDDALEKGKEYSVIKEYQDADGNYFAETVESSVIDEKVTFRTTDVTSKYYLAAKTVSATGALLFASTEGSDAATDVVVTSGDYTATITKNTTNTADYTLAEDAPESATVAGYFSIALTKGGTNVTKGPSITFKIAVPTDVTASEGKQIKWQVVRVHNYDDGNGPTVELLSATEENGYIVFSSEYFSDFALIYTEVAADTTTTDTTEEATDSTTDSATDSTTDATTDSTSATTADSSTTSTTASEKTGDNSMMPLFMTTLLLALCAGSLAIYKEKKTN